MSNVTIVPIALAHAQYEIHIGESLLTKAGHFVAPVIPSSRVVVITDDNVASLYLRQVEASLHAENIHCDSIVLPEGEATKSFEQYVQLMNELLALSPDRKTTLIALGGGVIGDITGFAAATLLRGVPFIQMPTTLLAQIDSSVGGKTGINAPAGKNLVGAFYQPKLVLADTGSLNTLSSRELGAGYAEMVKYAALGDTIFFDWLEQHGAAVMKGDIVLRAEATAKCCAMKAAIVIEDEKEQGRRALLNLGHTFGHALEAELAYDGRLLHGEGVAIGMVLAAQLSAKLGLCDDSVVQKLEQHMKQSDLPTSPRDIMLDWNVDALMQHMSKDKKNSDGAITTVLLRNMGDAFVQKNTDADMIRKVWEESCHG